MAIPNTTQIPNNLFDGEMQKMKDTELRITLVVARKTLGWIEDEKTGMRKKEDWISHSQLKKLTGRSSRALSPAIENCIQKGWIEARGEKGEILDTKGRRRGKKIFYRLGKIFLDKVPTSEKSSIEKSSIEKSSIEKSKVYKINPITKNITTNTKDKSFSADAEEDLIELEKLSGLKASKRTEIQEIVAFYKKTFQERFGEVPIVDWGKSGKMIKRRLKEMSKEELKDLIKWFFSLKKVEYGEINASLSVILSEAMINQWKVEAPPKEWRK